jgi:hypothetical protein
MGSAHNAFTLVDDDIALPKGAFARTHRKTLMCDGRPVMGLTQGRHRPYVFPLFTPAGFAVTTESPADHPHHNSFWIAADHVHGRMPAADGRVEEYTYNFYVDETFQGRAPGSLVVTGTRTEPRADATAIIQEIEWRGPAEWAAPAGRMVARETRTMTVQATDRLYVIDIDSRLAAADWDFSLGPTRHAYFNIRVAPGMTVPFGGTVVDDRGHEGGTALSGGGARWVDFSGPVGGGHRAGLAVFPDPRDHDDMWWFVADWGVVTVGPFRLQQRVIRKGDELCARYRVLVHDGDAQSCDVAGHYDRYLSDRGRE